MFGMDVFVFAPTPRFHSEVLCHFEGAPAAIEESRRFAAGSFAEFILSQ